MFKLNVLALIFSVLLLLTSVVQSKLNTRQKSSNSSDQNRGHLKLLNSSTITKPTTVPILINNVKRVKRTMGEVVRWTIIDEAVDIVVPMVVQHLSHMKVTHLTLPNIKERISVRPLILSYNALLELTNGQIYGLGVTQRYGHAYMTYKNRIFDIQLYLHIANLKFEYHFVLKLLSVVNGYGKIIGFMDNIVMFLHLGLNISNREMFVHDFRLVEYHKMQVNLDEGAHLIRDISGIILTPITNLFRERVIASISDNLKDQFQLVLDDFNSKDPLGLQKFVERILSGLTGHEN